jgi:hypothetical protein
MTGMPRKARRHRIGVGTLLVAGTISAFLAIAALWVNRQALDTDNWTEASSQMLEDPAIRVALSGYLVDQLYANVDVAAEIRGALPERAQPLAGPAAGALRNVAEDATNELLQRPRVQALWENANRAAHETFLNIVKGGGERVSTEGGVVTLNLAVVLQQLAERTGVGGNVAGKIPPDAAQLELLRSDQLSFAQDVANSLRPLAIVLLLLMLAFYGGAIALASDRRRETVRAVGFGLIIAGALALLLRSLGGDAVVSALAKTEGVRPAVESVWRIGTSLLNEAATATIGYGVVLVFGAWLAGSTRPAVATRRSLAPYLREPGYAWGAAAAIVLLVLIWGPTPGTRKVVPALILIGLFAIGVEALRRATAREFPTATTPGLGIALRDWAQRLRATPGSARGAGNGHGDLAREKAAAPAPSPVDPLDRLERLAALHDRGVLSDDEFAEQKQGILTSV